MRTGVTVSRSKGTLLTNGRSYSVARPFHLSKEVPLFLDCGCWVIKEPWQGRDILWGLDDGELSHHVDTNKHRKECKGEVPND